MQAVTLIKILWKQLRILPIVLIYIGPELYSILDYELIGLRKKNLIVRIPRSLISFFSLLQLRFLA